MRGRGGNGGQGGGGSGGGGGNGNNNKPRHMMSPRSQTFDSNGPGGRIRGNAYQVYERYLALARDAQSSSDGVNAENLLQHAEHYFRIIAAANEAMGQRNPGPRPHDANGNGQQEQPSHGPEGAPGDGGSDGDAEDFEQPAIADTGAR